MAKSLDQLIKEREECKIGLHSCLGVTVMSATFIAMLTIAEHVAPSSDPLQRLYDFIGYSASYSFLSLGLTLGTLNLYKLTRNSLQFRSYVNQQIRRD